MGFSFVMNVLLVFLFISSAVSGSVVPRIIGGQNAKEGKYPYQVSIQKENFHICGGSIINHRYILTAAHCIYRVSPTQLQVIVGTNDYILHLGTKYDVSLVIWNNNYGKDRLADDIGLLRVNKYIEFSDKVQPISLPSQYYVPVDQIAVVTGWGKTHRLIPNFRAPLQEINVTVIAQEICEISYWQVTKNNICTFTKTGEGVCSGDSGSPLVVNDTQIGIVSYGRPCAIGYPDVYTRVFPYNNWINQTVNAGTLVNPNACNVLLLALLTIVSYLHSVS